MKELFEKLTCMIGEGIQASSLEVADHVENVFHREVVKYVSTDLSFISGWITTGLRGSAYLEGSQLVSNYGQLLTAVRQHLPLVVHTDARPANAEQYTSMGGHGPMNAISQTGCFQLIAASPQQEVYLSLIAHRIAELSLIPGVVIADHTSETKAAIPSDDLIIKYLGNPDDQIESPTPSQEMIFGNKRRRIPNWFSLDVPVMLGPGKDNSAIFLETAAAGKYFHDHLPSLIKQAYREFNEIFDTDLKPVTSHNKKANHALISMGGLAVELLDGLPGGFRSCDLINFNQAIPFPSEAFLETVKKKKAVTILENTGLAGTPRSSFQSGVLQALNDAGIKTYSATYSSTLDAASLELAIKHMITGQARMNYHLGLDFTKESSDYPIHQILLQEIEKLYPGIKAESINSGIAESDSSSIQRSEVPLAVRMYKDKGANYSRLSRFYNDTAFFYETKQYSELVADPFAAVPAIPSESAGFFNKTAERTSIPILDTSKCTGCGNCFVHCPHSAIPPIAITVEDLINAGIRIATSKGAVVTKLAPVIKNLSKVSAKIILNDDVSKVGDFLPAAFESLISQMKLEGEKLDELQSEMEPVINAIENLPIAITEDFFKVPNTVEKGSGELFSLAVDPTACTGCAVCTEVCDEAALHMEEQHPENLSETIGQFKLWEQLPDTAGTTINRLHHDKSYSSLAAMLLSRSYYMSMTGGNALEKDTPYKSLLHIITAATESVVQPKIVDQIKRLEELITALTDNVHQKLSNAIPSEDLESLSTALKQTKGDKLSLEEVIHKLSGDQALLIDSIELERKTDLADSLKTLKWALSEGPTGVGRSRFGMLLAGADSMEWTRQYPVNNFAAPSVIHWDGSAPGKTMGLFQGQLRFLLDNIKLMRRATLESKDKYDPGIHDAEIAGLKWESLTEEEKQMVPPILLIAERDDLNRTGWNNLNHLLAGKFPAKVFLMDHCASPVSDPAAAVAQTNSGLFSTIALKSAFVFQGGLGNTDHLFDGILGGLAKTYPALFNLYALKQQKHNVENIDWTPYAALALNSRAFPALRYDPGEKSDFLSGSISLDGNRSPKSDWVKEKVELPDGEIMEYAVTWADWAQTQAHWKAHFMPLESKSKKLLLSEYIPLSNQARKNHRPVIMRAGPEGLIYYSVSPQVVEMTETVLAYWRTLQELGGLLTEFPLKLRTQITKELSDKYEQDAAKLKEHYEKLLSDQQAAQTEVLRQQLKAKLVALAGMAKNRMKV